MEMIENKDRVFLVKHKGRAGVAILENEFVGLVDDPYEHARSVALEIFYEPYKKDEAPKPKYTERGKVVQIEASA